MESKKLYRIPSEGYKGGICAGLGEYLTIDPTIIRLLFILFSLGGGTGILLYLIMLFIVPVKPQEIE
jgi:phage shock protein C